MCFLPSARTHRNGTSGWYSVFHFIRNYIFLVWQYYFLFKVESSSCFASWPALDIIRPFFWLFSYYSRRIMVFLFLIWQNAGHPQILRVLRVPSDLLTPWAGSILLWILTGTFPFQDRNISSCFPLLWTYHLLLPSKHIHQEPTQVHTGSLIRLWTLWRHGVCFDFCIFCPSTTFGLREAFCEWVSK